MYQKHRFILAACLGCQFILLSMTLAAAEIALSESLAFREIWAYVMADGASAIRPDGAITDLAWFSAGVSSRGKLVGVPPLKKLAEGVRNHLVLAETGNADRMHFVLDPQFGLRDQLVADLMIAAAPFDGIQIDFESIEAPDGPNFREFLILLKAALGDKCLSIALPGRYKPVGDTFDYAGLAKLADRFFIMAYDEHWGGGDPGAIASLGWSTRVATHAKTVLGASRIIMGLPFYGRIWAEANPAGAYRYSSLERIRTEQNVDLERDAEGIPFFRYDATLRVTAYLEDWRSITQKLSLYRSAGLEMVGFWRLGLEDPAIWPFLSRSAPGPEELARLQGLMARRYHLPSAE